MRGSKGGHFRTALVRVEQLHKGGSPDSRVVKVLFGTAAERLPSDLQEGIRYVLFLERWDKAFAVAWLQWAQWEVNGASVQNALRQADGHPPIDLSKLLAAIRAKDPDTLVRIDGSGPEKP